MRAAVSQPSFVLGAKPSCCRKFAVVCGHAHSSLLVCCFHLSCRLKPGRRQARSRKRPPKLAAQQARTATTAARHAQAAASAARSSSSSRAPPASSQGTYTQAQRGTAAAQQTEKPRPSMGAAAAALLQADRSCCPTPQQPLSWWPRRSMCGCTQSAMRWQRTGRPCARSPCMVRCILQARSWHAGPRPWRACWRWTGRSTCRYLCVLAPTDEGCMKDA